MPLEFLCQSCSSKLKVPEEHAGEQAKCPKCSQLNRIPNITDQAATPQPFADNDLPNENRSRALDDNPYASSMSAHNKIPQAEGTPALAFQPLFENVFYLKFIAWFMIIGGALYCLTIVGIVIAWIPI